MTLRTERLPEFSSVVAICDIEENDTIIPRGARGCIVDIAREGYQIEWFDPVHTVTAAFEWEVEEADNGG